MEKPAGYELQCKSCFVEELEGEEPSDGNQVRRDTEGARHLPQKSGGVLGLALPPALRVKQQLHGHTGSSWGPERGEALAPPVGS